MMSVVQPSQAKNDFFKSFLPTVNPSSVNGPRDGGSHKFRQFNTDYSEIQRRTLEGNYHTIEHIGPTVDPKKKEKDKKWSIGKLFRRKKKDDDSGTSSESDEGISTRSEPKRKSKKKKRPVAVSVSNFDHIVVNRDGRRAQSVVKQKSNDIAADEGILSDPSAGFIGYRSRGVPNSHAYLNSKESLHLRDDSGTRSGNTSLDGSVRKTRKGRMKARVEAIRNSLRKDSSSDEESQKSSTSSSMIRFRSDDSLMNNSRDGSLSRKSRSARTERYVKRISRDDENQLNKEAELLQQGYSKAEVEMLTRTPTSQSSGYGTCKRENPYANTKLENLYSNEPNKRPMKSESISSFPSTYNHPSSINFNAKINNESIHYSIPYTRSSANREPTYVNNCADRRYQERQSVGKENILCVKFPLGNVTNITRDDRAPPVPPPRDLQRKVATPVSMLLETEQLRNTRSMMEDRSAVHGVINNDFHRVMRRSQERSLNPTINGLRRPMSNSEDHIAIQNNDHALYSNLRKSEQPRRPASVSAEPNHYGLYANAQWRNKIENPPLIKPEPVLMKQDFLYYADQSPRSRRPISIQSSQTNLDQQYLSDSQATLFHYNNLNAIHRKPRNASEFWRKIDDEESMRKRQNGYPISRTMSEQNTPSLFNSRMNMPLNVAQNNESPIHKPAPSNNVNSAYNINRLTLHNTSRDTVDSSKKWKSTTEYKRSLTTELPNVPNLPLRTHTRHKSETLTSIYKSPSDEEKSSERRKSTNLDDALNELEAIYNSLGLGDEDLLDRAERRELMSPKNNKAFNDWNGNDEIELRSQPTSAMKRHAIPRRSTLPDKLQDDMAFRRLNSKERPVSKDSMAQISYMLASPVYVPYAYDDEKHSDADQQEPDIIQDDVVYRNIRQANNHLKLIEPQPPFGIPLGPITPAPQSDYLHATPENKARSRFITRRSPDLVSDDMAYRTLRKDNRNTSLFGDDYECATNNNNSYDSVMFKESAASLKKKRAVRSLSANIFSMIQKEIDDALTMSKLATIEKAQSNSDVNKFLQKHNGNSENVPETPRNKVKQRHNTVNIFVSNAHQPSLPFAKDDAFVNKDDKYLAKPPLGDQSKSSSPLNRSPQPAKKPTKDEFQQVLTMLAQEAMDTSNKLGVALAELDKNKNNYAESKSDRQSTSDARSQFLYSLNNRNCANEQSPEIKLVQVHSEIIQETNLEEPRNKCVDNDSKGQKTKDSLLAISDQLHKVEDKLKHSFERELNEVDESLKLSDYIAEANQKIKAQECKVAVPENKIIPRIVSPKVHEDIVLVQNKSSDLNTGFDNIISNAAGTKVKELNEIKSFNDLKEGISDLLAGISQVNEKLFKVNGSPENEKANNRESVTISVYEDDLVSNKDTEEPAEYNSSEELATIFKHEDKKHAVKECPKPETIDDKRCDLNSPRLVQSVNHQLRRFSVDCTDNNEKPSQSQSSTVQSNIVPWRTKRHNSDSQNERRDDCNPRKARSWYQDPGTLMLACSYTLVYSQQLIEMDWLTLLGLLLAMISIIAMLII